MTGTLHVHVAPSVNEQKVAHMISQLLREHGITLVAVQVSLRQCLDPQMMLFLLCRLKRSLLLVVVKRCHILGSTSRTHPLKYMLMWDHKQEK